jgi:hypothetical protein
MMRIARDGVYKTYLDRNADGQGAPVGGVEAAPLCFGKAETDETERLRVVFRASLSLIGAAHFRVGELF